jgi:ElaB/YqjD/DUF883 family membrane-anchored ribosome-binding protein
MGSAQAASPAFIHGRNGWRDYAPKHLGDQQENIMADENMNPGVGMAAAENKLESDQARAQHAAEALKSATTKVAEDYRDKAEQSWDETKVRVRTWQEEGEEYVRENPTKAVFTALGIGFVLGLIVRH